MNFVTQVFEYMSNDDENSDKSSERILRDLSSMTPDQKKAVDNILINLCGFCSDSIIEALPEEEDDEETAHENQLSDFYGSSDPVTIKEKQDEARKLK